METFILYSYSRSSSSYRVRIGLFLKSIHFKLKPVHLLKSEQFKESFKKINPLSQIPCLKHGERVLSQSLPILLYLEEIQAKNPLLPKDPFKKASILSFCEIINSGIQPLQNLSVLNYVESESHLKKATWAKHWVKKGLIACESVLKTHSNSFCFGDQLSLADVFLIPQLYSAKRFGIDITQFPTLDKINQQCLKLPAFKKAHPDCYLEDK